MGDPDALGVGAFDEVANINTLNWFVEDPKKSSGLMEEWVVTGKKPKEIPESVYRSDIEDLMDRAVRESSDSADIYGLWDWQRTSMDNFVEKVGP